MVEAARLQAVLELQDRDFHAGIARASSAFDGLASKIAGGFAVGAGIAGFNSLMSVGKGAFDAIGDAAIGMNSKLQQAQIGFETMLHSGQDAKVFLAQLADFAKTTPFEFKELIPQAQRLKAMGFEAQQVIPLLTDVGNVAAAMGSGSEGVGRITLALGQMHTATVVHAQDMNQLIQAGVPAWELLAQATGKSTAEVRKMSEEGKIAADTMINAFHAWAEANVGGMMEKQSHTFEGAMSNIKDALTATTATAFRPFFDMLTRGANVVADALGSDQVQVWAGAFQGASNAVIAALGRIKDALAPMGAMIEAAFNEINAGDVSGAFSLIEFGFEETFKGILATIDSFTGGMASAGYNLIATFAQGIVDAGAALITQAVTFIADLIGSFLIGESPPPKGPLRSIDIGGRRVVEAYIDGMVSGAWGVEEVAQIISDGFGEVNVAMGLEEGRAALKEVSGDLNAVKAASEGIGGIIDGIGTQLSELGLQASEWKLTQEDIKLSYEEQLDPIDRQIEALKSVKDWQDEILGIQLKQEDIAIRKAERDAKGDPRLRAELEGKKEALRFEEKQASLDKQRADLAEQAKEKRNKKGEVTGGGKDISDELKIIDIKQKQLEIEKQEAGLVNKGALAELAVRKAINDDKKDGLDISKQEKSLASDLAVAQLEEQRSGIADAMKDALEPGEEALRQIQRRTDLLDIERERWQLLKGEADDYIATLEEALGGEGAGGKAGGKGRKAGAGRKGGAGGGAGKKGLDIPAGGGLNIGKLAFDPAKLIKMEGLQKAGQEMAGKIAEGFKAWVDDHMTALITGGLLGAVGGIVFGPIGAIVGTGLGLAIGEALDNNPEFQAAMEKLKTNLGKAIEEFRAPGGGMDQAKQAFTDLGNHIKNDVIGPDIGFAFAELGKTIQDKLVPGVKELGSWLKDTLVPALLGTNDAAQQPNLTTLAGRILAINAAINFVTDGFDFLGTKYREAEVMNRSLGDLIVIIFKQTIPDAATHLAQWVGDRFDDMGTKGQEWLINVQSLWNDGIVPAFEGIKSAASTLKDWVGDRFSDLGTAADTLKTDIGTAIDRIVDYYIDRFFREAGTLKSAVSGAFDAIGNAAKSMYQALSSAFDAALAKVRDAAGGIVDNVNKIIDAVNRIPAVSVPRLPSPGFAEGGIVPGPIGMPRAATVHGGEIVLNRDQQRRLLEGGSGGSPIINIGVDRFERFSRSVVNMEESRSTDRTSQLARSAGRV